ncbi:MAG: hypothetical protein JKP90_10925 [Desulfofustis sp. PB-SRB1]|nr:hypothetical protein [Desulfofustis sp. PB-SRB1]
MKRANRATATNAFNKTYTFGYDTENNLTTITDPPGADRHPGICLPHPAGRRGGSGAAAHQLPLRFV